MNSTFPRKTILILLFPAAVGALRAQDIDSIKTWSVEEFAQKMTDQMTPRVPLSPEQVVQAQRINLKFAGQVMPVVKGTADQKKKIAEVKEFDKQRCGELAVFLDPEQMRQVRQVQNENRRKMKQRYYERH